MRSAFKVCAMRRGGPFPSSAGVARGRTTIGCFTGDGPACQACRRCGKRCSGKVANTPSGVVERLLFRLAMLKALGSWLSVTRLDLHTYALLFFKGPCSRRHPPLSPSCDTPRYTPLKAHCPPAARVIEIGPKSKCAFAPSWKHTSSPVARDARYKLKLVERGSGRRWGAGGGGRDFDRSFFPRGWETGHDSFVMAGAGALVELHWYEPSPAPPPLLTCGRGVLQKLVCSAGSEDDVYPRRRLRFSSLHVHTS